MTYSNVASGAPILASTINDLIKYGPAKRQCQLEGQSNTSLASGSNVAVPFSAGSEVFDDDNWHDTTTNNTRITPTTAGRYRVSGRAVLTANINCTAVATVLFKNGSVIAASGNHKPNGTNNIALMTPYIETYVDMNGTTDYVELYINQTSAAAAAQTTNNTSSGRPTLIVELVRAA
jgi:hypothetical protein